MAQRLTPAEAAQSIRDANERFVKAMRNVRVCSCGSDVIEFHVDPHWREKLRKKFVD